MTVPPRLILASTSVYRRELLDRLRVPFECRSPGVDERELTGEVPIARAERLAIEKAQAVARQVDDALVIGADQVAVLDDQVADKPLTHANAFAQLRRASGRVMRLHSAIALVDTRSGALSARVEVCTVHFRVLSDATIEAYLAAEQPYDCAGRARIEALGIALASRVESSDPTTIIGLPLIALVDMLEQHGLPVLPR